MEVMPKVRNPILRKIMIQIRKAAFIHNVSAVTISEIKYIYKL